MVDSDDDQQLIPRHRRALEKLVLHRPLDEPQFRCPTRDGGGHLRRISDRKMNLDQRMSPSKRDEAFGKPIAGDGLTGLDGQRASLQAGVFAERELGGAHSRQDGPRLREKRLAGLGQLNAAPDAIEELRVVARLQRRDRMARGGLCEIQRLGGSSDVLAFSDRNEDAELLEGHFDFLCNSIYGRDPPTTPPAAYRRLRNSSKATPKNYRFMFGFR